jgi:hypothetical protein
VIVSSKPPHNSVGPNSWRATSNPGYLPPPNTPWPEGTSLDLLREDPLVGLARDVETEGGICRAGPPSRTSTRPVREVWILEGHPEHCDGQDWNEVAFQGRFPGCLEFEVNMPAIAASGQRGRWRHGSARR